MKFKVEGFKFEINLLSHFPFLLAHFEKVLGLWQVKRLVDHYNLDMMGLTS